MTDTVWINQGFTGAALGDDESSSNLLPALGNRHDGDVLRRKRPAQEFVHSRRNGILEPL